VQLVKERSQGKVKAAIDANLGFRYTKRMFGISGEHLVILGIILLIAGPKRLPQLGNTLGKAMKNFKDGLAGVQNAQFRKVDDESESAEVVSETKVKPSEKEDKKT
jgi:sec-independent protein translocase protein TatA